MVKTQMQNPIGVLGACYPIPSTVVPTLHGDAYELRALQNVQKTRCVGCLVVVLYWVCTSYETFLASISKESVRAEMASENVMG